MVQAGCRVLLIIAIASSIALAIDPLSVEESSLKYQKHRDCVHLRDVRLPTPRGVKFPRPFQPHYQQFWRRKAKYFVRKGYPDYSDHKELSNSVVRDFFEERKVASRKKRSAISIMNGNETTKAAATDAGGNGHQHIKKTKNRKKKGRKRKRSSPCPPGMKRQHRHQHQERSPMLQYATVALWALLLCFACFTVLCIIDKQPLRQRTVILRRFMA